MTAKNWHMNMETYYKKHVERTSFNHKIKQSIITPKLKHYEKEHW